MAFIANRAILFIGISIANQLIASGKYSGVFGSVLIYYKLGEGRGDSIIDITPGY